MGKGERRREAPPHTSGSWEGKATAGRPRQPMGSAEASPAWEAGGRITNGARGALKRPRDFSPQARGFLPRRAAEVPLGRTEGLVGWKRPLGIVPASSPPRLKNIFPILPS